MIFPFFFPLRSTSWSSCNCADKVIYYLEEQKYEWVRRDIPKEVYPDMKRALNEGYNQLKSNGSANPKFQHPYPFD